MVILKNYNKFLVGTTKSYKWEDFGVHRHATDLQRCVRFDNAEQAESFLQSHLDVEEDFDAWIVDVAPDDWMSHSSPWEPRRVQPHNKALVEKICGG